MEPAKKVPRVLLTTEPARIDETVLSAEATNLVRDLVNIPAGALGPAELQKAAEEVAAECGASVIITSGTDLVSGYPMIHAVGMAATAERAPRPIELEWGDRSEARRVGQECVSTCGSRWWPYS